MINKLINLFKVLVIPLGVIFLTPIILTILNVFGLKTYDISLLIIMLITALITGIISGRKTEKNGYLNGLILGVILCLIMFIISLIFKNTYKIDTLIYYLIIIASSTVGSMIGIQKTNKKD
ncbi:MAG: TIGR04086 family membrane protein [Bacilli bacterium]|nr:TIGR04086 family membrane protein [Bacilli bacterium]